MLGAVKQYFNRRKLVDESFQFLFEPYEGDEAVAFDCETTGLDPKHDEIIAIGAVRIKGNRVVASEKFERFFNPQQEMKVESIKIHHLLSCDLVDSDPIEDGMRDFLHFIGNRPLVGYYLEFDVAMVNKAIKPFLGISLPNKQIEVSGLYFDKKIAAIPEGNVDLRFDSIMEDLRLPPFAKHNALGDAIMAAMMYIKLINVKFLEKF
ncbi:3'-5' exonuclease [Desulfurispira natronophila]|uniref:DNA polymerase-3 subunit epsilon n=1 Tax=Desulfurispira natronophila TaxID=682562 RepID=A0A7W7Y3L1_9BACT|nr:3'-5' exonuclease [Desulfurispira natronophila]MBB5021471.1 DNA polymerase-3 subunit epsilon [Desulfurispira natronophila]